MGDNLVGQDLRIRLRDVREAAGAVDELRRITVRIEAAVARAFPGIGATWEWAHGPDTLERAAPALMSSLAEVVSGPDSTDSRQVDLGGLVLPTRPLPVVWRILLRAETSTFWRVLVEPRLRRRRWFFVSHMVPGRHSLSPSLTAGMTSVLAELQAAFGAQASCAPGDPHWMQTAIRVTPPPRKVV